MLEVARTYAYLCPWSEIPARRNIKRSLMDKLQECDDDTIDIKDGDLEMDFAQLDMEGHVAATIITTTTTIGLGSLGFRGLGFRV